MRNFPIVGRFRYWFERFGPPLRQYIVTGNDEERPFSRDQRRWVYASSKKENNYFGFGTDNDLEQTPNYLVIRQSTFPISSPHAGDAGYDPLYAVPCAKVLGGFRKRAKAFRPASIVNTSAMSYGSLSGPAVEAINRGVALAGAWQNTGEGGISDYHRKGGDLCWQIGTGYFGCRDDKGNFSLERFKETVASAKVRAIEIKLSRAPSPASGACCPKAPRSPRRSPASGSSPSGRTASRPRRTRPSTTSTPCSTSSSASPTRRACPWASSRPSARWTSGRPSRRASRPPAARPTSSPSTAAKAAPAPPRWCLPTTSRCPSSWASPRCTRCFAERDLHEKVVFVGSGKLGFPQESMLALGLGCDLINVAREAMLAIGCIQAQECHTGHCPTGIATQNRWLMGGLDPTSKAARLANYPPGASPAPSSAPPPNNCSPPRSPPASPRPPPRTKEPYSPGSPVLRRAGILPRLPGLLASLSFVPAAVASPELDAARLSFHTGGLVTLNLVLALVMFGIALDLRLPTFASSSSPPAPRSSASSPRCSCSRP
jgi:hypothetical protein